MKLIPNPHPWAGRWAARLLVILLAMAGAWAGCAFLRVSGPADIEAYLGMASECHPVWKQFALRRFGPGDSAQELFRRFPPTRRLEFGRYSIYSYDLDPAGFSFTKLAVVTRDGRLLSAQSGSCTWEFTFFQTQDPELDREYASFIRERHREQERRALVKLEDDVRRFYMQRGRWPTNTAEFGWFVTGEKPMPEPARSGNQTENASIRVRYGFAGPIPNPNPLGITLTQKAGGQLKIAMADAPDLARTVQPPRRTP